MGLPEVGPALAGEAFGLGAPPSRDPGVIAGTEDFRDGMALEELGSGELRIFQQALAEAFICPGGLLAHDARNEPDAGVEQGQSRDFAARQNIVAERDFLEVAQLNDALVDALEPAAQNDRAWTMAQFLHPRLSQWNSARAHQQARPAVARRRHGIDGAGQHIGLHDHAGAAPGGGVVNRAVLVERMAADVDRVEAPDTRGERLAGEAHAKRPW